MTDQASIDAMVEAVVGRFGGIDILVNNAGVFDMAPILEITRKSYASIFAVNVEETLFTLQACARQMVAQGHGGRMGLPEDYAGAAVFLASDDSEYVVAQTLMDELRQNTFVLSAVPLRGSPSQARG